MFEWFSKKAKPETVVAEKPVAQPTEEDYVLTADEQRVFNGMVANEEGMVKIGDVTHGLLHQQSQYISRHLDKSVAKVPFLGEGLRFDADAYSHHEYKIHKDDVLEFVARVKAVRRNR